MTRFLPLAAVAAALALSSTAQAAEVATFATVDVAKAMKASSHWKTAAAKLESQRAQMQAALEKKQAELKARKAQLDAQKALADPAAVAKDEEALFRDAQLLSRDFMQSQQQLGMLEKKATEQMLTRLEAVVREVAMKGDYSFVFDTGSPEKPNVLHAKKGIDITDQVIAGYKKHFSDKPLEL